MAETKVARKTAPASKKAPAKKAPAKKAAVKKAPAKKAAVKKAAVKKAAPAKKAAPITAAAPASRGAAMLAEVVADEAMDALPYAAPELTPAPRRFSNRFVAVAVISAVAIVALAGGAFALTRDRAPSKIKFIATADEVCRPANGPVTAIVKPTSYPELATAAGTVVSTTSAQMTQLTALKKPGGADGKAFAPTLKAFTATNTAAKALQSAATKADDVAAIAATKDMSAQFADANTQAKAYGFAACATGMQPGIDSVAAGSHDVLKTAFTAKADSLCRAGARKSEAVKEPAETLPDLARYLTQLLEVQDKLTADLKALPIPPGDETAISEMFTAVDKLSAKVAEMRDATRGGDLPRLIAGEKEVATLGTAADAKFDAYGLGVCGSNFGDT